MPIGPFRTHTHGVNVAALAARFEAGAEVTPEALLAARVLRTLRHPVKILGDGELDDRADRARARLLGRRAQEDRGRRRHRRRDRRRGRAVATRARPGQARRGRGARRRGRRAEAEERRTTDDDDEADAPADGRRRERRAPAGPTRAPRATRPDGRAAEHLARARFAAPAGLHLRDHRALPRRLVAADAGRQHGVAARRSSATAPTARSSASSTSSPAARSRTSRCSRSGSCRTSRPRSSCS